MKIKKRNLIIILISLIGIISYVSYKEQSNLLMIFSKAKIEWILGTLLLMVVYWGLESFILHLVTAKLHPRQKFKSTVQTTMIGQFFNCITPFSSGGQPMQALHMVKTGVPFGIASSCLLTKFIVYQVVLTLYSLVVLYFKLEEFSQTVSGFTYMVWFGFAVNTAVVLGLLSIGYFKNGTVKWTCKVIDGLGKLGWVKDVERKKHYIRKEFDSFYKSFKWMKQNKEMILAMMICSVIQLTVYFLVPYFILRAFNLNGSVISIISAQAFVLMISSFIPLPGAAGGAEVSFFTFFRLFFPPNLLNVSILIWRMITFYLTICVGMCFTFWKKDERPVRERLKNKTKKA
ncbi:lysylphosphatidylglycerol synthase transmembrane domain-containing protein [Niameybacter massiliensis]|uniref:Phosphatidylglycerol lysyltransferase n=1 Tax=Holtiella tumoricola TaxID=3018743 RepID=A0AA42J0K1_9FIRM|nr:lysylphosphatidylglycerol synthase transmembrane domain-containing protein [Holtiella tumoricola]MDA3731223.1 lysylphosphatidylglycerol synthase transmembrane domain-containing protein [Holtiella tumoricola]